jgi:hypothetical protein
LNGFFGIFMVINGLIINKRYGGHGDTSSGNSDKTVAGKDKFSLSLFFPF